MDMEGAEVGKIRTERRERERETSNTYVTDFMGKEGQHATHT